ncbi:hypothetical protein PENTCL1PPCAC_104 [Pristionchus entomophagus]|uniref:Uncharacterized protein n=1 Tax=Pristionchus entomophagus TaxID=358040 RepID=A0AAV5S6V0_9BILA|nr:hypothetical protein PENTCL1PPCAC_104 [Pristionchus entomophagus]
MEITREEAPLLFLYVFLSTTLAIMMIYFMSLLVYHCVFWPKILAKIKADKPKETAKQQQILLELAVGRDRQLEDKTQSERTETPTQVGIERTQSVDDFFNPAATVVSENASLVGDKTPNSVRTCAATVTAAPAGSPTLGQIQTAKESRGTKGRRWFEDDMMTTGMEILQPPRGSESKDHRKRNKDRKRSEDIRTGREDMHLRTGRERKEGGKTARKLRFNDDLRTCMEKAPLLSQSFEEARKSEDLAAQKKSEELRRRRKGPGGGTAAKEQQPRSVYAYEADSKDRSRDGKKQAGKGGTSTAASKSTDNTKEKGHEKMMELCKTQED